MIGATIVAVLFVLPSFLMVWGISVAYVRFGGLPWMQAVFYGVGAAVIGIVARSAVKLTRLTLRSSRLLWIIGAVMALTTAWTEREIAWLFILAGCVAVAFAASRVPPLPPAVASAPALVTWALPPMTTYAAAAISHNSETFRLESTTNVTPATATVTTSVNARVPRT